MLPDTRRLNSASSPFNEWVGKPPSKPKNGSWHSTAIADVDNDGSEESVGLGFRLVVFEDGSTGERAFVSDAITGGGGGDMAVTDIDGDTNNEVVLNFGDRVELWRCSHTGAAPTCGLDVTWPTARPVRGIDAVNADGVGGLDLVVGTRSVGESAFGSVRVDSGGGWAFGSGVDVGDVDGDGTLEIVFTVFRNRITPGEVHVVEYVPGFGLDFAGGWSDPFPPFGTVGVRVGDTNNDGFPDFVVGTGKGFVVYERQPGQSWWNQTFEVFVPDKGLTQHFTNWISIR